MNSLIKFIWFNMFLLIILISAFSYSYSQEFLVEPEKDSLVFRPQFEATFLFTNKDTLLNEDKFYNYLNAACEFLKKNPGAAIRIVGHSCLMDSKDEETAISKSRSDLVKKYILSRGINRGRILDRFVGSTMPTVPNTTEEGKQKNNRVTIVVVN